MRKPRWWSAFLGAIETAKPVTKACQLAGVSTSYVYRLRDDKGPKGKAFREAWQLAEETRDATARKRASR